MSETCIGNVFTKFLRASGQTTNTKVNKLISCIESEKNHKNIVLLLIELAENHDLSSDTKISLHYYLDMFENLKEEPPLSETGILLLKSAVIYGRRVDNIHFAVENLLLSLINAENITIDRLKENKNDNTAPTSNTVTKGRKRTLDQINKTYEVEMNIKRFKTIANNNRFEERLSFFCKKDNNEFIESVIKSSIENLIKGYTNPQSWLFASIKDFDYEDEVDLKKKYKLLTYHLEHRYNTLTPDINFKMYFKIKDYIDAVYKDSTNTDLWPPLSDAYIERFVNLENQILHIEGYNTCDECEPVKINKTDDEQPLKQCGAGIREISTNSIDFQRHVNITTRNYLRGDIFKNNNEPHPKIFKKSLNSLSIVMQTKFSSLDPTDLCKRTRLPSTGKNGCDDKQLQISNPSNSREDLTTVRVLLPHLDDEGVYFSELDERDQQMLSPAVIATDMFRCIKDKTNIVVIIDDVIKRIYNIQEPKTKKLLLPILSRQEISSFSLNFLKIDHKYLKKRRAFKLGPEFHLLKRERLNKICNQPNRPHHSQMYIHLCEDVADLPKSPLSSPNYEPDFLGFPEEILQEKNRSLSRDSGIGLQIHEAILGQELNVDLNKLRNRLEYNKHSPQRKNNTTEYNKDGLMFKRLTEDEDTFIQSFSLDEPSFNDYNLARSKNISHINMTNDVMLSENITSLMTRVQQWHMHLQPLLMHSKDRHHFDILKLGAEILNNFEERNQHGNIISFQNVMENKDSSLVSRYFLSTLLLANQGNISIDISSPNSDVPTDLNNVGLRFLNKTRFAHSGEVEKRELISSLIVKEEQQKCVNVAYTTIRTLKSSYKTSERDEHDSGISMSDDYSI